MRCLFIISVASQLSACSLNRLDHATSRIDVVQARENLLINSTILSTLIGDDSFAYEANFSFIELDRLCNSLERKVFN